MSVKTDPASAEIPSAEVFVPAAILDPDFPGLRAVPGQPLSSVQFVASDQSVPTGSSVPSDQSVPCDQSVPGDISVAPDISAVPGLRAAPVQPLSCVQSVLSGQPDPCDLPGTPGQSVAPDISAAPVRPVSPKVPLPAGPPCPGVGRSARMEPGRPGLPPPLRVCPLRWAHSRWRSIPSSSCNPSTGRITVCWRLLPPGASGV